VAGPTGGPAITVEVLGSDGSDHAEHLAGGLLGFDVFPVPLILDVAMGALDPEDEVEHLHHAVELRGGHALEDLDVVVDLTGGPHVGLFGCFFLGRGSDGAAAGQQQAGAQEWNHEGQGVRLQVGSLVHSLQLL
jgi:hypothetical protein